MAEISRPTTVEFKMPSLGSDMESGTVIAWRVAEGDDVAKGDVLLDVDTDKSDIEVAVWQAVRIERIASDPVPPADPSTSIWKERTSSTACLQSSATSAESSWVPGA